MQLEAKEANMWMSELTGGGAYLEPELTEEGEFLESELTEEGGYSEVTESFENLGGHHGSLIKNDHILALR